MRAVAASLSSLNMTRTAFMCGTCMEQMHRLPAQGWQPIGKKQNKDGQTVSQNYKHSRTITRCVV